MSNKRVFPIVAVHDRLIGYKTITVEQNEAIAERGFTNSLLRILKGDDFSEVSPEDLALYCLGTFDMDSGVIEPCNPRLIVHGNSVVVQYCSNKCDCENSGVVKEV